MARSQAELFLEQLMQQEMSSMFSSEFHGVKEKAILPFLRVLRLIEKRYATTKPEVYKTLIAVLHNYNPFNGDSARKTTIMYIENLLDGDSPELADYLISILPAANDIMSFNQPIRARITEGQQPPSIDYSTRSTMEILVDPTELQLQKTNTSDSPVKCYNYTAPSVSSYVASQGIPPRVLTKLSHDITTSKAQFIQLVGESSNYIGAASNAKSSQSNVLSASSNVSENSGPIKITEGRSVVTSDKNEVGDLQMNTSSNQMPITILSLKQNQTYGTQDVFPQFGVPLTVEIPTLPTTLEEGQKCCILIQQKPRVSDEAHGTSESNQILKNTYSQPQVETVFRDGLSHENQDFPSSHTGTQKNKVPYSDDPCGNKKRCTEEASIKQNRSLHADDVFLPMKTTQTEVQRNSAVFPYKQQFVVVGGSKFSTSTTQHGRIAKDTKPSTNTDRHKLKEKTSNLLEETPLSCLEKMVTLATGIQLDPLYDQTCDVQTVDNPSRQTTAPCNTLEEVSDPLVCEIPQTDPQATSSYGRAHKTKNASMVSSQGSTSSSDDMFDMNQCGGKSDNNQDQLYHANSADTPVVWSDDTDSTFDVDVVNMDPSEHKLSHGSDTSHYLETNISPNQSSTDTRKEEGSDDSTSPCMIWAPSKHLIPWKIARAKNRLKLGPRRKRKPE